MHEGDAFGAGLEQHLGHEALGDMDRFDIALQNVPWLRTP
jgi:hypothetical protein